MVVTWLMVLAMAGVVGVLLAGLTHPIWKPMVAYWSQRHHELRRASELPSRIEKPEETNPTVMNPKESDCSTTTPQAASESLPPPIQRRPPVLGIHRVAKYFGEHCVFNNVSFTVDEGQLIAICGPSGCGKTSLLYLLAGLVCPDRGTICWGGNVLCSGQDGPHAESKEVQTSHREASALIFQNLNLIDSLQVLENVAFPLICRGWQRPEAIQRAHEILQRVRLEGMASRYPHQLSRGQQQRIAIAQAMHAQLILADEPTASLDPQSARETMELLRSAARHGRAVVVVTHDLPLAHEFADLLLVFDKGRLFERRVGIGRRRTSVRPAPSRLARPSRHTNSPNGNAVQGPESISAGLRARDAALAQLVAETETLTPTLPQGAEL